MSHYIMTVTESSFWEKGLQSFLLSGIHRSDWLLAGHMIKVVRRENILVWITGLGEARECVSVCVCVFVFSANPRLFWNEPLRLPTDFDRAGHIWAIITLFLDENKTKTVQYQILISLDDSRTPHLVTQGESGQSDVEFQNKSPLKSHMSYHPSVFT